MESIRLYFILVIVTGTLWKETSGLRESMKLYDIFHKRPADKKAYRPQKIKILEEAEAAFAGSSKEVRLNLAPSYGSLGSNTLKQLDKSLKIMMGGILEIDLNKDATWSEVQSALDNNPFVIRKKDSSVSRLSRISFNSVRYWGFNHDNKERVVKILSWFDRLIKDGNILHDTNIDLFSLATMVSRMTLDIFDNLFSEKIRKMTLIDLGILRFPDISQPYFTLYRINLMGKCSYDTYLVHQKERSDVVGLFQKEVYYPNEDHINKMSDDLMDQLLSEVDNIFSD